MEVVASLSQGRTAAAQCGLFTYKSVPVIFEPPCKSPTRIIDVPVNSYVLRWMKNGIFADGLPRFMRYNMRLV